MNKLKLHWLFSRYMAPEGGEGSAGAGSAPASDAAEASFTTDGSDVDWGSLSDGVSPGSDDEDADDGGGSKPAAPAVVADPPARPETGPEYDEDGTPLQPAATPDEPAPDAPKTPVEEPGEQKTPEQIAAEQEALQTRFKEWQVSESARLEKEVYALSEDDAARLQTEPELVLPQLAAKMHMTVMQNALEAVQRMLPQMLQPELKRGETESKAQDMFFKVNSDLTTKDLPEIIEAGKLFRKRNPKATPEEAAQAIGEIVRAATGRKTRPAPVAAQGNGSKAPHRPPAAGSRGAAASPKPKAEPTKWDEFIDE